MAVGSGWGDQGGLIAFVKIQKRGGGRVGGHRVGGGVEVKSF